jgi:catechol 2,3-dioxygenase-like lactoylglutathione lyase family enzyme
MRVTGIVETAISVADVQASARFYEDLFGFERMVEDSRLCALNVAPGNVLLIFQTGSSLEPVVFPGGIIPPHDSRGQQHFAFGIVAEDFDGWCARLQSKGIAIESIVNWPLGGRSIYFRDPDAHAVELMIPGVWKNF